MDLGIISSAPALLSRLFALRGSFLFLAFSLLSPTPGLQHKPPLHWRKPPNPPFNHPGAYAYESQPAPPAQPGSQAKIHTYDESHAIVPSSPTIPRPSLIPAILPLLACRHPRRRKCQNTNTITSPNPPDRQDKQPYNDPKRSYQQTRYYGYRYCAPSEAWHLLRGESPRRKSLKGGSREGQERATRFVASLAGVKERRKRMNDTTEA
jgi:hypothetical protein